MHQTALKSIKSTLVPGRVYRRKDLAEFSSNLDRCLSQLVKDGDLRKLSRGLYECPSNTEFGTSLPDEHELIKKFLMDDHFAAFSLGVFNSLGLGTTQLYDQRIVVNRKRHGEFRLGNRDYFFHRRLEVPRSRQLTKEYFVIELLNRLNDLAEDQQAILDRLQEKMADFDQKELMYAKNHYATYSAKLKFDQLIAQRNNNHVE